MYCQRSRRDSWFLSSSTEFHCVIATSVNKTLKVPSTSEAGQSQILFVLPPGSIDLKNGKFEDYKHNN